MSQARKIKWRGVLQWGKMGEGSSYENKVQWRQTTSLEKLQWRQGGKTMHLLNILKRIATSILDTVHRSPHGPACLFARTTVTWHGSSLPPLQCSSTGGFLSAKDFFIYHMLNLASLANHFLTQRPFSNHISSVAATTCHCDFTFTFVNLWLMSSPQTDWKFCGGRGII